MVALGFQHIKIPSARRQSEGSSNRPTGTGSPVAQSPVVVEETTPPQFIPLLPSHNMTHATDGFSLTTPDRRTVGIGYQGIGTLRKNEDFAMAILVQGGAVPLTDSFLKKDNGWLSCITHALSGFPLSHDDPVFDMFQKITNEAHDEGIKINKQSPIRNGGGACVAFGGVTNRSVHTANAGDVVGGITGFSHHDQAPHQFVEMTKRRAEGYPAGQRDWDERYSKHGFQKENGYIHHPSGWALQPTAGIADYRSRYQGFDPQTQEAIKRTATNLSTDEKNLMPNDHACFFSDGLDVNPTIRPYNHPRIPLDRLKDPVEQGNAKKLADVVKEYSKGLPNRDDQIIISIDPRKLEDNEIVLIITGDGHGGSGKISKKAAEIFCEQLKQRFQKAFPNGVVHPLPRASQDGSTVEGETGIASSSRG